MTAKHPYFQAGGCVLNRHFWQPKKLWAIILFLPLIFLSAVNAAPMVNGSIISWPANGWYQVQSADTYETVCEGGTECTVGPGTYIVINHSDGSRYENIQVSAGPTHGGSMPAPSEAGGVTVVNNEIVWPDDGWYQVQDADTLVSVCEGGTRCSVSAGTYTVINHTTGDRFENIVVTLAGASTGATTSSSPVAATSGLTVIGNRISWPDDGWYQVQNADNYTTVCEGGSDCSVPPGRYQVINLTSGIRFDIIEVENAVEPADSGGPTPATAHSILNQDNLEAIIQQAFQVFTGRAYDARLTTFPYSRTAVSPVCNAGNVEHYPQEGPGYLNGNYFFTNTNRYIGCGIADGTLSGLVYTDYDGFPDDTLRRSFSEDFRVDLTEGSYMTLAGDYRVDCCRDVDAFSVQNFNYFFTYSGGTLEVSDANTYLRHARDDSLVMGGHFSMRPPVLNGASVAVQVTEEFSSDSVYYVSGAAGSGQPYYLDRGRMQITSGNSRIVVNANAGSSHEVEAVLETPAATTRRLINFSEWEEAVRFILPSSSAVISHLPVSGNEAPALGTDNFVSVIGYVMDIFRGARFGRELLALPAYSNGYYMEDGNSFQSLNFNGFGPPIAETCAAGGNAIFTPYQFGARQITYGFDFSFTNCNDGVTTYEGQFSRRNFGNFSNSSTGISLTAAGVETRFEGAIGYKLRSNRGGGPSRDYRLNDVRFSSNDPANSFDLVADFVYEEVVGFPWYRTITGGFEIQSAATSNHRLRVDVLEEFGNSDPDSTENRVVRPYPYYSRGVLSIDGGSSRLLIRAGNGDVDTLTIELTQQGAETLTFIEPWTRWMDHTGFIYSLAD